MSKSGLERLTVLGAGVLGGQIAWHGAFKGKTVVIYDPYPEALDKARAAHAWYAAIYSAQLGATEAEVEATRARLSYTDDLAKAVADADLVIEAVPEMPDIKAEVYHEMAGLLPERTIVVTNSSTFLPRDFAEATGRPAQFCALHFANMIWALNVVEIMAQPGTAPATLEAVTAFAIEIGQVPVPVRREQNGYILNTWFVALLTASQSLVTNGIATPEDVDRTYMIANRGCAMGPMGMIDMVGIKLVHDISHFWGTKRNDRQMLANAAYLKERFLDRGLQGAMGGEGYYRYPDPAYTDPGFLAVPDIADAPSIARFAVL
ncbi:3-hydroxyacyl-CoA dehydrogenase [Bradyrhizobium sp. USDA 3315]